MTLYRNYAGQEVFFSLVSIATGEPVAGADVAAWIAKDGGAQAAGTGTVDDLGNGQYRYNFSQGDTNGGTVGLLLLATGCVPGSYSWTTEAAPASTPSSTPATPAGGWTQAHIDTLKAAMVDRKGARSLTFSDQSVTFDSIDDMLKLLAVMQQDVATAQGRSTTRYAATSKGV